MSVTNLEIPSIHTAIFQFEDLWTPEGYFRITIWRDYQPDDSVRFGFSTGATRFTHKNTTVLLRGHLITTIPILEQEAENFLSEITTHDFSMGLFNTNSIGDVISVTYPDRILPMLTFDRNIWDIKENPSSITRLIFKYIKPSEETELYCLTEFLPNSGRIMTQAERDAGTWQTWCIGQAQSAIDGVDYRWYHASDGDPRLDENKNKPYDAEQIFDFKFIHSVSSGLAKVPSRPQTSDPLDTTPSWPMTFLSPAKGMLDYPWRLGPDAGLTTLALGIKDAYTDNPYYPGVTNNPRWARHIDAYWYLYDLFTYTYGAGKWRFTCEIPPIGIEGAKIQVVFKLGGYGAFVPLPVTPFEQAPSGNIVYPQIDRPGQLFLPQSIWGLYDLATTLPTAELLSSTWPRYHQSAWNGIEELCMLFGWIPLVSMDSEGIASIYFKDRTQPFSQKFTGLTPVSATPQGYPESENGIQVDGLKSFLNGRTIDGWYDDILAVKKDLGVNYADLKETMDSTLAGAYIENVTQPQANPYVVPATASKPAKIQQVLRCGGYGFFATDFFTWLVPHQWPNTLLGIYSTTQGKIYNGTSANWVGDALEWCSLAPLVLSSDSTPIMIDGSYTVAGSHNPDLVGGAYDNFRDALPAMRLHFKHVDSTGASHIYVNDSVRQCLARFYGLLFVKSDRKYTAEDASINQFWQLDSNGDRTGEPSWQNVQLFYQRLFPDGFAYWCKRITRDPNTMKTGTEYLRVIAPNDSMEGNFGDSTELTGSLKGQTQNNGGSDPSNITGG